MNVHDEQVQFAERFKKVLTEMSRVVVGQQESLEALLVAVFSGGHVLLTGVPGLGRTLIVKTLAKVLGLSDNRVQFTPDLLPSDVLGSEFLEKSMEGGRKFRFLKGPIFCNLLLADEINRSPARTQSALLEAMVERQVTVGGQTHRLPSPFIVLATRNNMEVEGVWRMPEAQIDRFMIGVEMRYPTEVEEVELIDRTTGNQVQETCEVLTPQAILDMQKLARAVLIVPSLKQFALAIVRFSRPGDGAPDDIGKLIRMGASPRAAQAIILGAKVLALTRGRLYVTRKDIKSMAYPVLEHRLVLDFRAASAGVTTRKVIHKLIALAEQARMPSAIENDAQRELLITAPIQD
jgi:MoxR-like ATPase